MFEQYDTTNSSITYSGNGDVRFKIGNVYYTGTLWTTNNISFLTGGTNGIQFQTADGTKSSWITGDGSGGINLGSVLNTGSGDGATINMLADAIDKGNILFQTPNAGIRFQNTDGSDASWITGDGVGGIDLAGMIRLIYGTGGYISVTKDLHTTGNVTVTGPTNGIQFQGPNGTVSAWVNGDGAGGFTQWCNHRPGKRCGPAQIPEHG